MKWETAKRISSIYLSIVNVEPDISTERLLQMTADIAGVEDVGVVVTALIRTGMLLAELNQDAPAQEQDEPQEEDRDTELRLMLCVMDADRSYGDAGEGSTKTWVREHFIPALAHHGLRVVAVSQDEPQEERTCHTCKHNAIGANEQHLCCTEGCCVINRGYPTPLDDCPLQHPELEQDEPQEESQSALNYCPSDYDKPIDAVQPKGEQ